VQAMTSQDREWAFLAEQTGMRSTFNDMYYKYLKDLGYTGSLQDMIAASGLGLTPLSKGGGIDLNAFMAAQSDGLWFDFTQTDRLFQENVGPTPANDPGEVIGLAMSQRVWGGKTLAELLAGQPELVT